VEEAAESESYGSVRTSFRTCTRVAVGTVAYVRGLQWEQSYVHSVKNSCYKVWAGTGLYRPTSTTIWVTSAGRTGGLQQICKLGFVPGNFVDFVVVERLVLSSDLVIFVKLLRGMVLPSEFLNLTKLQNINFVSHMC
jgi:hypothetical protein